MQRLREVLRYEYIGAITIGFLLAQAVGTAIGVILRTLQFFLVDRGQQQQSIFGAAQHATFPWSALLISLITVLLYAAAISTLLYWLYWRGGRTPVTSEESTVAADLFE